MSEPSQEFKDAAAVLKVCGHVSRQVYLEMMNHMEDIYPGRGWIEQADALEDFYDQRNLPLTGKNTGLYFGRMMRK